MTSIPSVFVFTFVVMILTTQFMMLSHVNCQVSVYKVTYFTDNNCTTAHTTNFYKSLNNCSVPTPARCYSDFDTETNITNYSSMECASEFPTPAIGFLTTYRYENFSLQCSGPIESVNVKAMNICMNDPGTSDFVIYDSLGNRNLFNDNNCASKNSTTSMYLGECLAGYQKTTTFGYVPPPQPPKSLIYSRAGFYNVSMSGGTSCSSSAMTSQFYSGPVSSCPTLKCQEAGAKIGGETFYQNIDCVNVTELPNSASYGSVNVYRHTDQNSCKTQTNVVMLEVYPINSCSPYIAFTKVGVELGFIKSDDCKFIRKYNDSSCLNEISKVDLSATNGICDSTGVKYLCNAIKPGGSGGGGNGGGVTPGNSTRAIASTGSRIHQLSLILSIVFTVLSIITLCPSS